MAPGSSSLLHNAAFSPAVLLTVTLAALVVEVAAASSPSHYKVLGVPKDADEKTIKQAYRKMALKWHPDKNPDNREEAERRFREVAEAYEVLSDPKRRKNYNSGGSDPFGGEGGFNPFEGGFEHHRRNPNDLFKEMFGDSDPFADFSKFFDDIDFSFSDAAGQGDSEALEQLERALSKFYREAGQPDKAKPESVQEILQMKKYRGKEERILKNLQAKYTDKKYRAALQELKRAFDKFGESKRASSNRGGGSFGDFGDFGLNFDLGNMGSMFEGGGGGVHTSFSFSSSAMSGGKTVQSETKIVNGKRVTKTIESDAQGTKATLEREEGGRIERQTGVKRAEQLGSSRDEM